MHRDSSKKLSRNCFVCPEEYRLVTDHGADTEYNAHLSWNQFICYPLHVQISLLVKSAYVPSFSASYPSHHFPLQIQFQIQL